MNTQATIWHLKLGKETVATVRSNSFDFPWTYGELYDSPQFERFRTYFSDDELWPDTEDFEDLCSEIRDRGRFYIFNSDTGESFRNVTFNQDGNVVWFRYS